MTCTEVHRMIYLDGSFTLSEMSAARAHIMKCPACKAESTAETERMKSVLNPEQLLVAEVAAARLGSQLEAFRASDPEAV